MSFKELIEALKNNFLEIIGFLLPGFVMYIIVSYCVNSTYLIAINKISGGNLIQALLMISISYSTGYLIYGVGVMKNEVYKSKAYTEKIENNLKTKTFFSLSLEKYNKILESSGLTKLVDPKLRELRSIVMGYLSEQEKNLIYTFMFRSDLSNHLYNICYLVSFFGILNYVLAFFVSYESVFMITKEYITLYILLLVSAFFLRKTRNHFYDKAMKTPFNIYNSK